jgi:glycine/D-amino acid oxidase-like deaminating enzyme
MINPVSGKRLVTEADAEGKLKEVRTYYEALGAELGVRLIRELSILAVHQSAEEAATWQQRMSEDHGYLFDYRGDYAGGLMEPVFGSGVIEPVFLVDAQLMISAMHGWLEGQGRLVKKEIEYSEIFVHENFVDVGGIRCETLIFCEGAAGAGNPWFRALPWSLNKGQMMTAKIPSLPRGRIYQGGQKMVPYREEDWWLGASFEWDYQEEGPTAAYRDQTIRQLGQWYKGEIEVTGHYSALRPSSVDKRPFVGLHPCEPRIGIMNGMGSKGYMQGPGCAMAMAGFLVRGEGLTAGMDVGRYRGVLGRDFVGG